MATIVKICGLTSDESVDAAVEAGADMVGFVFFPPSPRAVEIDRARQLAARVPEGIVKVALSVDADDALLAAIAGDVGVDLMQLQGMESPERVQAIRDLTGLPVMKAVPIADHGDVVRARRYEPMVDRFLFDAKPPKGATRPGGNAMAFDWQVLAGETWSKPWMLAGGLTAENVADAIRISGAPGVDVSSAVEDGPGFKNPRKIRQFVEAVRAAKP